MPTIQIEARISERDLLKAVEQLSPKELQEFVREILTLRAQRDAPHLPESESELLLRINQGIAEQKQRRYRELVAKRRAETLTAEELAELQHLTDEWEQCEADRLARLAELARLRGTTLARLMSDLGIRPASHE